MADQNQERIKAEAANSRSEGNSSNTQINTKKTPTVDAIQKKSIKEEFNILKDYIWTLSENKNNIINNIPKLIATEYSIETSPLVQNLKSSYAITAQLFSENKKILGSAIESLVPNAKGLVDTISPEWVSTFLEGKTSSELVNKVAGSTKDIFQKIGDATNANAPDDHSWQSAKLQELYKNLYTLKSSGKKFIFPYMDDEFLSLSNNFSEGNEYLQFEGGLFSLDTSNTRGNLKKFSNLPALLVPGAYIQSPQFYDFSSSGCPVITINFPLYNNVDSYETSKNMKFVKLFGLNNMPYRQNLLAVDPTKIYDILIPGKANFPLCYVSNYVVDHIGTKSLFRNEIYPEAYNVQITFTSLIKYDANMFIDAMNMKGIYTPPPGRKQSEKSEISQADQFKLNAIEKSNQQDAFAAKMEQAERDKAAFMGMGSR
jgi:hypothetical protein